MKLFQFISSYQNKRLHNYKIKKELTFFCSMENAKMHARLNFAMGNIYLMTTSGALAIAFILNASDGKFEFKY